MTIEDKFYNNIKDYFLENLEGVDEQTKKRIGYYAEIILNNTGHIPIATNIAYGAGYCAYYARLSEGIGVKKLYYGDTVDKASGKGNDAHKILGLVSLIPNIFEGDISDHSLEIGNKIELLEREELLRDRSSPKIMYDLLYTLKNYLKDFRRIIDCDGELFPVVEQQFLDYDLHIRGIPDLVLENRKEKKAIVIDWKTPESGLSKYEEAQVVAYSLLEAKRLGYEKRNEIVDAITGKLDESTLSISDIKILPVIIRASKSGRELKLKPHPVFSEENEIVERYKDFKKLVNDVLIEAEHLTLLIANQKHFNINENDTKVKIRGREVKALKITPYHLWRGNPEKQDKYPCASNGKPICKLRHACKFYLGRGFGVHDEFDSAMWKLRYRVLDTKEKSLLIYRAIYSIFKYYGKDDIINAIRNGNSISVNNNIINFQKGRASKIIFTENMISGSKKKVDIIEKKVDVLDEIKPQPHNNYMFIGKRSVRDFEKKEKIYAIIRESDPVLLSVSVDALNPLLSINMFGRIDDIEIEDDSIKYLIGIPSRVLKYQAMLFREYLNNYPEFRKNVLMFSIDVDLTHMELSAIDSLQRALGQEKEKYSKEVMNELRGLIDDYRSDIDEVEDLENQLKKVISSGVTKR